MTVIMSIHHVLKWQKSPILSIIMRLPDGLFEEIIWRTASETPSSVNVEKEQ